MIYRKKVTDCGECWLCSYVKYYENFVFNTERQAVHMSTVIK